MIHPNSVLVALILLIDQIPMPDPGNTPARRGRPKVYPDRLFLKALVMMIVRRLPKVQSLLAVLAEPTPEMQQLRLLLHEHGRYPSRRTFERRLQAIPDALPAQIGCLGRHLLALLNPFPDGSALVAIDSTPLRANGGVWHRKHRQAGEIPHTSIDTEAHWTKSGWHGWVYGWKLHLVVTVAAVWIPLAAELTPANTADNEEAPMLLAELPAIIRFILGDTQYDDTDLHRHCAATHRFLVTSKRGPYPHRDDGVEVRRVFHELRHRAIENFNGQFKDLFDCRGQVPTRGLNATRRFILGAVLVYQLVLWYRFVHQQDLRVGLKSFLNAA